MQQGKGSGAVAQVVLDQGAQFAKGLVIFGDQKERIIAKTGRAPWRVGDSSASGGLDLKPGGSPGVGQAKSAAKARPSFGVRAVHERV